MSYLYNPYSASNPPWPVNPHRAGQDVAQPTIQELSRSYAEMLSYGRDAPQPTIVRLATPGLRHSYNAVPPTVIVGAPEGHQVTGFHGTPPAVGSTRRSSFVASPLFQHAMQPIRKQFVGPTSIGAAAPAATAHGPRTRAATSVRRGREQPRASFAGVVANYPRAMRPVPPPTKGRFGKADHRSNKPPASNRYATFQAHQPKGYFRRPYPVQSTPVHGPVNQAIHVPRNLPGPDGMPAYKRRSKPRGKRGSGITKRQARQAATANGNLGAPSAYRNDVVTDNITTPAGARISPGNTTRKTVEPRVEADCAERVMRYGPLDAETIAIYAQWDKEEQRLRQLFDWSHEDDDMDGTESGSSTVIEHGFW